MKKQALVVDDSRVARLTLAKLLASYDLEVIQMASGEEALSYLRSNSVRPDIIFMDVMMTGIDGLEATTRIKENSDLNAIPVVICTGHDTEKDISDALAVGALAVLSKPPEEKALSVVMKTLEESEVNLAEEAQGVVTLDNNAQVIETIMARIELEWMPKLQQDIQVTAKSASQKSVIALLESSLSRHMAGQMPSIQEKLQAQTKQNTIEVAQQAAQQIVTESADSAVQSALDSFGLEAQSTSILEQQSKSWLTQQEQQITSIAKQQVEQQVSPFMAQYLDDNLNNKIASYLEKIEAEKPEEDTTVVDDLLDVSTQLVERVTLLNKVVIGLGIALFIVAIIALL